MISARTKTAMAAAKARGIKLGSPTIAATNRQAADRHAEALRDIVGPIKHLSTRRIAAVLNERGIETARGGRWQPMTVARLLDRLGLDGVIDPVVIFGWTPSGEKFPSKAGSFFDNTPYISAPPKKAHPAISRTSPWIAG